MTEPFVPDTNVVLEALRVAAGPGTDYLNVHMPPDWMGFVLSFQKRDHPTIMMELPLWKLHQRCQNRLKLEELIQAMVRMALYEVRACVVRTFRRDDEASWIIMDQRENT